MSTECKRSSYWLALAASAFMMAAAVPVFAGMTLGPEGEVIEANQENEATRLLGPEYKDEVVGREAVAGFRLHTPAGARLIQRAGLELLSFVQDKYQWAGTVAVATFEPKEFGVDEYLKATAQETAKNFKAVQILESRAIVISDKPAGKLVISMEGVTKDRKAPLYMQQVAVKIAGNQYMVLSLYSPLAMRADADKTFNAMVKTFQVMDRKQIEERRLAAVKAGREWFNQRSAEELIGKLRKESQLFRIKVDNRDVGYLQIDEKECDYLGYRGILVSVNSRTFPEDGSIIMANNQNFWAFDKQPKSPERVLKLSLWMQSLKNVVFVVGGGGQSAWSTETGTLQFEPPESGRSNAGGGDDREVAGGHYLLTVTRSTGRDNKIIDEKGNPQPVLGNHGLQPPLKWEIGLGKPAPLPKVLEFVWPRVVDLSKPGQMAFSVFNSSANPPRMALRTLSVVGPDDVTIDGRTYKAIKLIDEMDPGYTTIWVEPNGRTVMMRTSDQSLLVPTTEEKMKQMWGARLSRISGLDSPPRVRP